jgi:hypothetical protein
MVVSGAVLLVGSSRKIVDQDSLLISFAHSPNKTELTLNWRETNLVLEYSKAHGLEFERSIHWTGLPLQLRQKYFTLSKNHSSIHIERLCSLAKEPAMNFTPIKKVY